MAEIWAAATAAAVIGAGATAYAANEAAGSAADAQAANNANARAQQDLEYRMFREGRGSGGSAILPLYFQGYEQELARDARRIYEAERAAAGTPEQELAAYNRLIQRLRPTLDASTGTIEDIYSGEMVDRRIASAQPVAEARRGVARAQGDAVLQSLSERLNALKADRQRAGFVGDSSFDRNRMLQATLGARQAAAVATADADYQNALAELGIRESGEQARLQYLDAPLQRAQQEIALTQLPAEMLAQGYQRRLQPFEPFRIGTQTFRPTPLPMQQAIPGTGQIVGTGIGQLGQAASGALFNAALMGQMQGQSNTGLTTAQYQNASQLAQQQALARSAAGYGGVSPYSGYISPFGTIGT